MDPETLSMLTKLLPVLTKIVKDNSGKELAQNKDDDKTNDLPGWKAKDGHYYNEDLDRTIPQMTQAPWWEYLLHAVTHGANTGLQAAGATALNNAVSSATKKSNFADSLETTGNREAVYGKNIFTAGMRNSGVEDARVGQNKKTLYDAIGKIILDTWDPIERDRREGRSYETNFAFHPSGEFYRRQTAIEKGLQNDR